MDPVTILAAATAAFQGIKRVVEMGREVQDVYSQLSEWAGHIGDFHHAVAQQQLRQRSPGLFDRITFSKSATAEAFDLYAARQQVIDMEKEIYHMFLYGALNHLGRDGYDEFRRLRREVTEQRQKMVIDQQLARLALGDQLKFWGGAILAVGLGITGIGLMISWVLAQGSPLG